jgi:hypothetical protein
MFNRQTYFDSVRNSLFSGHMAQSQVDGQDTILSVWEKYIDTGDRRWLAYMLATTYHETAQEMQPIEEYNKGQGQPYGEKDPDTGQTYYGRGYVQLTWRDNYARADTELNLSGDASCEEQADNALNPWTAARVMYKGMVEGWFRGDTLGDYFSASKDDPYGAREIINGDKDIVPSWSNGESIGQLIAEYHAHFLEALNLSWTAPAPGPDPKEPPVVTVSLTISTDQPIVLKVVVNGDDVELA